jgi:EAL domain-containing protein (putative c-di-GMP-specific phosphodiesterase class I)
VELAHALKLQVIAKGVERPEEPDFVTKCDCDAVQGYIFSRRLTPEAVDMRLSEEASFVAHLQNIGQSASRAPSASI